MAGGAPEASGQDAAGPDLRSVGERIDTLLDASASGGAVARERAEELVRLVADLYGAGLERVLEILYDAGQLDDSVLAALADDDLVSSLLIVHGLHPYGVGQRVERALEQVRPYLGSHGGDVELLDVTADGVVRLRLLGSCDGCPSSSVTLQLAVEGAIEAAAPEVTGIEVETPSSDPAGPLIPVESLTARLHEGASTGPAGSWERVPGLAALRPGELVEAHVQQTPILVCRVAEDLYAFRSACARCGATLAGATLARRLGGERSDALLVCPVCQAHYAVRRAGACLDDPDLHLDPLPLLHDGDTVSVAVPRPVPS